MASDALHALFLERALAQPRVPAELAKRVGAHRRWAQLGSVLIDLPYFDGFASQVLGHFTGAAVPESPWGDRFHRGAALGIARGFLEASHGERDPGPFLALAMGHLTHVALDLATHAETNRLAEEESRRTGRPAARCHRDVENVQAELWYRERTGRHLHGSPTFLRLVAVRSSLFASGEMGEAFERALRRALAEVPALSAWRRWTFGLWQFGALLSGPLRRMYLPERMLARAEWYRSAERDFAVFLERAAASAAQDLIDAFALWQAPAQLAAGPFHRRFPERDLDHPDRPLA